MTDAFTDLLGALAGVPRLDGPRCVGKHHLFDPPAWREPAPDVGRRHAQALTECERCPALADCRRWLGSLPRSARPSGVVAAQVIDPPATYRTTTATKGITA